MKTHQSSLNPGSMRQTENMRSGYILGDSEGENLNHFRDHGRISIKVNKEAGCDRLALATQQVMKGSGIPAHRHLLMDEVFYVLEGSGTFSLDSVQHPFSKGSTIFIPQNTWHAFENSDHELLLLWVVAPASLDGFFRETCSRAGEPAKDLTQEEIRTIALKYGTEFR